MKFLFIILFSIYSNCFSYEVRNINLERFDNKEMQVIDFKKSKKIIVLNFWATWCTSCIEELPILHKLQKKSKKDVEFYAISAGDTSQKIKKFTKKYPFHYKILMDKEKEYSKSLGVESLPVTIIIKDNNIIYSGHRPPKEI